MSTIGDEGIADSIHASVALLSWFQVNTMAMLIVNDWRIIDLSALRCLNIFAYQYDWPLVEFKTTLKQQSG